MFQYVFILGRNPGLSLAEIKAVLPKAKVIKETNSFLILEDEELDFQKLLNRLGGTVKIGQVISQKIDSEVIFKELLKEKSKGKINFGISNYGNGQRVMGNGKYKKLGLEVKKKLKEKGISSRLVTSKEPVLSSVVIAKNRCQEFLILSFNSAQDRENQWLGKTLAVQKFEDYSQRDYGRPSRDTLSGTMPPKLAKIMINLVQMPKSAKILDPFCGSGTILQEALLLGYKNVIGADTSDKAIGDTKKNLNWLSKSYKLQITSYRLFNLDVKNLSQKIAGGSIDAVITEPYLGPPLKGKETRQQIKKIIDQLSELYLMAFSEFRKILSFQGRVVIIFPAFRVGKDILELPILEQIKKLGFTQLNQDKLIYSRPGQKIWRQIFIFTSQF